MYQTDDFEDIRAEKWSEMPSAFRRTGTGSSWADANRHGEPTDSFLEGPCFDFAGNLLVVDIPFGRIFKITNAGDWNLVAEYDGWPNGLKVISQDQALIADYRRGLMTLSMNSGLIESRLAHRFSEGFKGLNDLHLTPNGDILFTDQGQTGLHDSTGRVYRLRTDGQLDTVLDNVPSPNGIALSPDGRAIFVAVTRDASVWRAVVMPDGNVGKVGRFVSFFGATGPDGIAFDKSGRLWVAHPSADSVWVVATTGEIARRIRLPTGAFPTNLALSSKGDFYITASGHGAVYKIRSSA